jgi:hypothetical protein
VHTPVLLADKLDLGLKRDCVRSQGEGKSLSALFTSQKWADDAEKRLLLRARMFLIISQSIVKDLVAYPIGRPFFVQGR